MTDYRKWATGISSSRTDYESLKRFVDAGITEYEFGSGWNQIHCIEWDALKENADRAGMHLWSFHLPFCCTINMASLNWETKYTTQYIDMTLMQQAAKIGIKNFVIHASGEPIADEDRAASMDAAKFSIKFLCDVAESLGGTLCVENLPRTCLAHNAEEMRELMDYDPRARICFDVNHLNTLYGSDHKKFMELCGDRIHTLHISDYFLEDELHLFAGNGKINWNELITMLEKVDYNGPFLYEGGFSPSKNAPEIPFATFEDARPRHLEIKNFYGTN